MRILGIKFVVSILVSLPVTMAYPSDVSAAADTADILNISSDILNISLYSLSGKKIRLDDFKKNGLVVIVAQGSSCPVLQKSYPDLLAIEKQFRKKGVRFILLSAAPQDEFAVVEKETQTFGVSDMVVQDPKQSWLQPLGLKVTGEAIVLKPGDKIWRVLYRGGISDRINFDRALPKAKNEFLRNALSDAVAGRSVKVKASSVFGCSITWI